VPWSQRYCDAGINVNIYHIKERTSFTSHLDLIFFSVAQYSLVGQGFLIIEASRSHSVRHTIIGRILWASDQPDTETSTWQHTTLTRDRQECLPAGHTSTSQTARPLGSAFNCLLDVFLNLSKPRLYLLCNYIWWILGNLSFNTKWVIKHKKDFGRRNAYSFAC
jgi:hypothetical protein